MAGGSGCWRQCSSSQHPREGELGTSLCGWHHSSGPSARGGSQGENPEGEALGRSQGGFSTKVHLRAEGGGKLITLGLTPGQRHEAPVFPRKVNECRKGPFDREVYKQRNLVERRINRLKQFRRLATRYEKRAANYRTMWIIAAILLWL